MIGSSQVTSRWLERGTAFTDTVFSEFRAELERDDVVRVLDYLGDILDEHGYAELEKMQSLNFVEPGA